MTLGISNSGKTNYIETSLLYVWRNRGGMASLHGRNRKFRQLLDETEDTLKRGEWLAKTQQRRELIFISKESTWASNVLSRIPILKNKTDFLKQKHRVVVEDWPGESFSSLALSDDDAERKFSEEAKLHTQDEDELKRWKEDALKEWKDRKSSFLESISDTGYFIVFIDGESLMDANTISENRKIFYGFIDELKSKQKERHFLIVVTKTDLLQDIPEFSADDGLVRVENLRRYVRDKYSSFFDHLEDKGYPYEVCAVSCVPVKEHRRVDKEYATLPTEKWSVDDMSNQLAPLEWIWKHFNFSL